LWLWLFNVLICCDAYCNGVADYWQKDTMSPFLTFMVDTE
ncbi:hypothetical protein T01_12056, partial [Trichinella spiralis]